LDAILLIGHVLQRDRSWLIAHGEQVLTSAETAAVNDLMSRRATGVPLAYLLGRHEFHGLMLRVTPDVLDPRPDTETLVDWALDLIPKTDARLRVLDLGTGSGAIALAIKSSRPACEVHATDASPSALAVAQGNAQALGFDVAFHGGSWWNAAPAGRFDMVLSNPPYIAEDDVHLADLVHEPRSALVAPEDGLGDLRCIIEGAPPRLRPGGWLLLEHGHTQGEAVADLLSRSGFVDVGHRHDLAGHVRCTGGRHAG
jgi:release factor glutamine methyltransferase